MSGKAPGSPPREQRRLTARGKRSDDGSPCTLLVVHEHDGRWTFHGLGAPGVTLSQTDTITLAEAILEGAWYLRSATGEADPQARGDTR